MLMRDICVSSPARSNALLLERSARSQRKNCRGDRQGRPDHQFHLIEVQYTVFYVNCQHSAGRQSGDLKVPSWRPQGIATTILRYPSILSSIVVAILAVAMPSILSWRGLLNRPGRQCRQGDPCGRPGNITILNVVID